MASVTIFGHHDPCGHDYIDIVIIVIMNDDHDDCLPRAAKVLISQSFGHDDNHDIQHDHHMHHDDHDVHDNYFP